MAHNIDTSTGSAAFYMHKKNPDDAPWHMLGQWQGEAATADEALRLAHLDWGVKLTPVLANVEELMTIEVPGKFVTYRDDTCEPLGVVGKQYLPTQNLDAFEWVSEISGEATFETAGALDGGRRVFVSANLNREILIDPNGAADKSDLYLVFYTAHDGTMENVGFITSVRPVCHNTVSYGLKNAEHKISRKHTRNGMRNMASDARGILGIVDTYAEAYQREAEDLFHQHARVDQFFKVANRVLGLTATIGSGKTRQDKVRDTLETIWDGETLDGIRNTAWGVEQALTEYVDWWAPINGSKGLSDAAVKVMRAERAMVGGTSGTSEKKSEIHRAVRQLFLV